MGFLNPVLFVEAEGFAEVILWEGLLLRRGVSLAKPIVNLNESNAMGPFLAGLEAESFEEVAQSLWCLLELESTATCKNMRFEAVPIGVGRVFQQLKEFLEVGKAEIIISYLELIDCNINVLAVEILITFCLYP